MMIRDKWFVPLLLIVWLLPALVFRPGPGVQANGSWSSPINLSQDAADAEDASIALDQAGNVHVVWSANGDIWHRYTTGAAWSSASRVGAGWSPRLAAGPQGRVHLVFVTRFENNDEIYCTSWQSSTGWQAPVNVSQTDDASAFPNIAVASTGQLAVVWSEEAGASQPIYIAQSADGAVWTKEPLRNDAEGVRPVVAFLSSSNLLVAWQNILDPEYAPALEIWTSQKSGTTWTVPESVSGSALTDSELASLAVLVGKGYLTWQEAENSGAAIYMSHMVSDGWSVAELWSGTDSAAEPQVVFDAQGFGHLLWTAGQSVRHRAWDSATGVRHPIEDTAASQPGASQVRVAAGSVVHVVWLREASAGNRDVWYSKQAAPTTPTPNPNVRPRLWLPALRKP
jgi:hypothetical protein